MPRTLSTAFGQRMRERRRALGLIQREIAAEMGMQRTDYVKLETGQVQSIRLSQLRILVEVLQTSADYLLGLTKNAGLGAHESVAMHRQRS